MKLWQLVLVMLGVVAAVIFGVAKIPELLMPPALSTVCSDAGSEDALAPAICDELRQR